MQEDDVIEVVVPLSQADTTEAASVVDAPSSENEPMDESVVQDPQQPPK